MSKKIIIFGPLPPPFGGVAIFMSALYEYLKGYGVRMWTYGGQKKDDPEIKFIRHRRLAIIPALLREGFKARIVDSSHFHLEYPNKILVPVWVTLKLLLRFEWLKIMHDGSLPTRYRSFSPVQKLLFQAAARSVNEFIVSNKDLQLWLQNEVGVTQKVSIIPCLLPVPPHASNASLPAGLEDSLSRYSKRVCSIGVFIPSYGFKHVAQAVEKIRQETLENVGLILLDGAFVCDESYRSEVLQGRDWITVLRSVPNSAVYQILKKSDVFVRSFGFESYGISRVEAILCGLPVVATRTGETRGMLLYDYGDEEELARQIKRALSHPPTQEIWMWAKQYQREAEENLQGFKKALKLGNG